MNGSDHPSGDSPCGSHEA